MSAQPVHTLILGAGPAGLTAGYRLTRSGAAPIVLVERDDAPGGLMRSIRRGRFTVDVGRKELYSRISEVDAFWNALLGADYRPYPHRFASLYEGHIIESSSAYRGIRRGMPWGMFLAGVFDLLAWRARAVISKPKTHEGYMYRRYGRRFSRVIAQGFWEKFNARKLAEMPPPPAAGAAGGTSDLTEWRHPARGTGQICELLEGYIKEAGGRFELGAQVSAVRCSGARVHAVVVHTRAGVVTYEPEHVVSSLPLEALAKLLFPDRPRPHGGSPDVPRVPGRSTILVYLFLEEPPRFPHAWLEVTTPGVRAGRITNYAAFNGDMVPSGQTCLCVEFFCTDADPLLEWNSDQLREVAMEECAGAGLIDPARCFDAMVLRLPGADAAVTLRAWQSQWRSSVMREVRQVVNLYHVNQPGTDHATLAGLEAAAAIVSGDRRRFDLRTDIDLRVDGAFHSPHSSPQPAARKRMGGGRGASGTLRVLLYHRVCDPAAGYTGDPRLVSATPKEFERQVAHLVRRYAPVTAHQVAVALRGGMPLPSRAVLVTFDDGYKDFQTDAWPILARYSVPALLFVGTVLPEGSAGFWWDELHEMVIQTLRHELELVEEGTFPLGTVEQRIACARRLTRSFKRLPADALAGRLKDLRERLGPPRMDPEATTVLDANALRWLASRGLAIGSHGRAHLALSYLSEEAAWTEVTEAHATLTQMVGEIAPFFSYPFGLSDSRIVPVLRDLGYIGAFTSEPGVNRLGGTNPFTLHRQAVNAAQSWLMFELSLVPVFVAARRYRLRLRDATFSRS